MPVLGTEIKFHPSGSDNLGGIINNLEEIPSGTLNALFDDVTAAESLGGMTDYRCIYTRNTNSTDTLTAAVAYFSALSASPGVTVELGLGTSGTNGTEQIIPNENTAPNGVTFQPATSSATGIALGDLAAGEYIAYWIKRTVATNTAALASDLFTVAVVGETV